MENRHVVNQGILPKRLSVAILTALYVTGSGLTHSSESIMEASAASLGFGSLSTGHQWVDTGHELEEEAVVILGTPSRNDDEPGVAEMEVQDEQMQIRFREWDYLDGEHKAEQIGWMMAKPGTYKSDDGTVAEVGVVTVSPEQLKKRRKAKWQSFRFNNRFSKRPHLFLTPQGSQGESAFVARAKRVRHNGFKVSLFEQEANGKGHEREERVAYVAIHSPKQKGVIDLGYGPVPFEIKKQRIKASTDAFGHKLQVEEEQSRDKETRHLRVTASVMLIDGQHLFAQDISGRGNNPFAFRYGMSELTLGSLKVASSRSDSLDLAWSPAAGKGAEAVVRYQVLRDGVAVGESTEPHFTDSALVADTVYQYQVNGLDKAGKVLVSSDLIKARTAKDEDKPVELGAPQSLKAVAAGSDSINLGWQPPAKGKATGYKLYRDGRLIATTVEPAYRDSGLAPATPHRYHVIAIDDKGNTSTPSNTASATTAGAEDKTPPTVPGSFRVAKTEATQVSMTWGASSDNRGVEGYEIWRDGVRMAKLTTRAYLDRQAEPLTLYVYKVRAYDKAGNFSGFSTLSVATPPLPDKQAPSVPGQLKAEADVEAKVVRLNWNASSDNVAVQGYEILRNGQLFTMTASNGFVDHSVELGKKYSYQVRAFDAAGNKSANSTTATAELTLPVQPPVTGQTLAETCVGCHGTDGKSAGGAIPTIAGMDRGYFIDVMQDYQQGKRHSTMMGRIAGAYSTEELALMADHFSAQDFTPANQLINLTQAQQGADLHKNNCNVCHENDGKAMDRGILAGQWKPYLLNTLEDYAEGRSDGPGIMIDRIRQMSATERSALVEFYASHGSDTQAPSMPGDIAIAASTETSLTLTWTDSDDNSQVRRYEIYRDGVKVADTDLNSFTDTGLTAATAYSYDVYAVDAAGNRSINSASVAGNTKGKPQVTDPNAERGHSLWQANSCQTCHGTPKDFAAKLAAKGVKFEDALKTAIASNRGGMGIFNKLSEQDNLDLGAYVKDQSDGGGNTGGQLADVALISNEQTLRKAAILMAARLPTEDEIAQAGTEEGLTSVLRDLMQGERFREFIDDTGNRAFLTAGMNENRELTKDFPALNALRDDNRREYNRVVADIRVEPLRLLRHIVENDRPYQEILTADHTMVTPRMASAYGVDLLQPFQTGEADEWVPARIKAVSARTDDLQARPYPHAGVLTTPEWLGRFPTTDSNRNRHRSKILYQQFLGVDIEALGQRPLDDSANGDYLVPTMENPACLLCHTNMEPAAGAFENWGTRAQYWQSSGDSLSSAYKSSNYYKNHDGDAWYKPGDIWYRDMLEPGFEGKKMPGGHAGFNRTNPSERMLSRKDWSVTEVSSVWSNSYQGSLAIDGKADTVWHSQRASSFPSPQHITIDMGQEQTIAGMSYLPRNRSTHNVGKYRIEVSSDGNNWSSVKSGENRTNDTSLLTFEFPETRARYLKLVALSAADQSAYVTVAELNALGPKIANAKYAENANGGQDSLQWLAREVAEDPRFAKAAVMFWYRGLFGRTPLAAPVDPAAVGYTEALAAYRTQDAQLEQIAESFKASGFKVRDLLVAMITSDLFRADGSTESLSEQRRFELNEIGSGRLLNADEIDAKGKAIIGRELFGSAYSGLGLLWGGFDGGRDAIEGNTEVTPMMVSTVDSRINTQVCDGRLLYDDLRKTPADRMFIRYAEENDSPYPIEVPNVSPGAGSAVERMIWTGVSGSDIPSLERNANYPSKPASVEYLAALETPENIGSNYGQRLRAYLVPAADGDYTFWAAGDDHVSLRISSDESATNLREIAKVPGYTSQRQWTKYPEQKSAPVSLKAGKRYFIEVMHKEGGGGDHLSVAWTGPGIDQQIIGAQHLAPVPLSIERDGSINRIKRNIQYLHKHFLGEELPLDHAELERTFSLFKAVYDNDKPEDSGLAVYCEQRNGNTPGRRAWNAVMAYLMSDFRFIGE